MLIIVNIACSATEFFCRVFTNYSRTTLDTGRWSTPNAAVHSIGGRYDCGRGIPTGQGSQGITLVTLVPFAIHIPYRLTCHAGDKYIKVKKYYFEKEDQVKQLQNSLANQRLAQSRTSLDDSEYSTRFSRLDGLIAQLAFSVRKSWNTVPNWLSSSVNKDAIATGKQEMTAAGRAFISCWLVEEVFEKYFHPDLETNFSVQLKAVQKNIRRSSPTPQSADEDAAISSRVTNWRLSTLDGLRDTLQSPQAPANRAQLIDLLNKHLIGSLIVHLQDPPMSDLQGGVQMIIELAVSIATHLPLESRDVQVDYYMPGEQFNDDLMRQETGIPPLDVSVAEDAGKKGHGQFKNILRFNGPEEDGVSRVRMAVGIGAHVRFKTTLVKAPVHGV